MLVHLVLARATRAVLGIAALAAILTAAPALASSADPAPQMVTPAPTAAPVLIASTAPYLIHARDVLQVQVFGDPSLSQTVTVLPGGDVSYPLIGQVHVGGQTTKQAAATFTAALKAFVRNPIVNIEVSQQGSLDVLVLGNVKNPGKYALGPASHLTDAIAAAGGMGSTNGPLPDARVAVIGGNAASVNLENLLRGGDMSLDVSLQDQTVVYIPAPAVFNVEVTGAVDHSGELQLNEGDHLSMAIAKAGTSQANDPDLNNIHVTRTMPDGKTTQFTVDLYKNLQQGDISKDLVLQKNDIVFVPKSRHGLSDSGGSASSSPLYLLLLTLRTIFPF